MHQRWRMISTNALISLLAMNAWTGCASSQDSPATPSIDLPTEIPPLGTVCWRLGTEQEQCAQTTSQRNIEGPLIKTYTYVDKDGYPSTTAELGVFFGVPQGATFPRLADEPEVEVLAALPCKYAANGLQTEMVLCPTYSPLAHPAMSHFCYPPRVMKIQVHELTDRSFAAVFAGEVGTWQTGAGTVEDICAESFYFADCSLPNEGIPQCDDCLATSPNPNRCTAGEGIPTGPFPVTGRMNLPFDNS